VHRLRVALCCALVFFCRSAPALAQSSAHLGAGLSGVVFAEGGNQPISNASVRLCSDGHSSFQEVLTGDSGEFSFAGLSPGRYTLQILATGFVPLDQSINLSSTVERGHSVFLKPARPAEQPPLSPSISAHELSMPESARELVASGKQKFYGQKNLQEGLKDFQSAVAKAPNYYEAYHQIGLVYLSLKNLPDAEKNLRKSVELSHGGFPDADIALGSLLADHGDPAGGERLLRRGLELYSRSWIGQYELAVIELSRGNLEKACQLARKAESLAPAQPLPHRMLAILYLKEKNYPELLEELDAFIAIEPDSPAGLRAKELRAQTQKALDAATPPSDVAVNKPH